MICFMFEDQVKIARVYGMYMVKLDMMMMLKNLYMRYRVSASHFLTHVLVRMLLRQHFDRIWDAYIQFDRWHFRSCISYHYYDDHYRVRRQIGPEPSGIDFNGACSVFWSSVRGNVPHSVVKIHCIWWKRALSFYSNKKMWNKIVNERSIC